MFHSTKTISKLIGAILVTLTITSAANAQQGSFQGQYSGVGDADGASLALAQSGSDVSGQLHVDGAMYMLRAKVSGNKGYGALGDPESGLILEFGILQHGADVYVILSDASGSAAQTFQFQRGGGATASVDRRARRRERVRRAFAGMALIGVAAAASSNNSAGTSGGSSSGARSSSSGGSADDDTPAHMKLGLPDPDSDLRGYNAHTGEMTPVYDDYN